MNKAPMAKAWFMAPMEYQSQWKRHYCANGIGTVSPMEHTPNKKDMVLWEILFGSGNGHGKRQKKYSIKDAMSIKISFMHYMKWMKRVMLPVIFEEFELVCIIWYFFSSHCHYQFVKCHCKTWTLAKIWMGLRLPQPPPGFYEPEY